MKLHLEATPEELVEKGESLVETISDLLRPASPDLASALEKAIPRKEAELKFPVLRELQKKTEKEYERQMGLMLKDIGKVLDQSVKKSEDDSDLEKGGPYIGPRGGRWADPQHTIPYKEEKKTKKSKQLAFVFDNVQKEKKEEKMIPVSPEVAFLANRVIRQLKNKELKHSQVEVFRRAWLTQEEKAPGSILANRAKKQYEKRMKAAETFDNKSYEKVIEMASTMRTTEDAKDFVRSEYVKKLDLDAVVIDMLLGEESKFAPSIFSKEDKKKREVLTAVLENHRKYEDTSVRKPRTTSAKEVAKNHGFAKVQIDPDLPKLVRKQLTGMLSNAFDDLSDVLGMSKLAHGGLVITMTSETSTFKPGYYFGAHYEHPGSPDPKNWTKKIEGYGRWGDTSKPPAIRISMERSKALAHEYGHAIDNAVDVSGVLVPGTDESWDVEKSYEKLLEGLTNSAMAKRAAKEDKKAKTHYWSNAAEMFARGFEQYVAKKLADKGKMNSLLTHDHYENVEEYGGMFFEHDHFTKHIEPLYDGYIEAIKKAGILEKALSDFDLFKAGPYIGPRGGKWQDPEHKIPWKEYEQDTKESFAVTYSGKLFSNSGVAHYKVVDEKDGQVRISRHGEEGYGPWMPKESVKHFVNDLAGKVDLPKSGRADIDAVIEGKAEALGKGDDGIAFKVGDKVVKVSTTVPYQPENPGHRTPKQAIEMLKKQVEAGNKLSDIAGIQRSEFVEHGDKGFQIKEWVKIPEKFTRDQLDQIQKIVIEVHKRGYAVKDDIQAGLDKKGKPVLFDIGKAGKQSDATGIYSDIEVDMDNLATLYREHGERIVRFDVDKATQQWQHFESMLKLYLKKNDFKMAHRKLDKVVARRIEDAKATLKGEELKDKLSDIDWDETGVRADIRNAEKEHTEKSESPDYTQKLVAKEEKTYEQIKQELMGRGYVDSDFEPGGPLYGYSTNELIDLARDKRND